MQVSSNAPITSLVATGLWLTDKPGRPTLLMNHPGGFVDETVAARPRHAGAVRERDGGRLRQRHVRGPVPRLPHRRQQHRQHPLPQQRQWHLHGRAQRRRRRRSHWPRHRRWRGHRRLRDHGRLRRRWVPRPVRHQRLQPAAATSAVRTSCSTTTAMPITGSSSTWSASTPTATPPVRACTRPPMASRSCACRTARYHRWSQDAKRIHFGLAGATAADITVKWPSGVVQTFPAVPANTLYRVTENNVLPVPVALGAGACLSLRPAHHQPCRRFRRVRLERLPDRNVAAENDSGRRQHHRIRPRSPPVRHLPASRASASALMTCWISRRIRSKSRFRFTLRARAARASISSLRMAPATVSASPHRGSRRFTWGRSGFP